MIQLEVGKRYVRRDGTISPPLVANGNAYKSSHPFYDTQMRLSFSSDGRCGFTDLMYPCDLVEEYPADYDHLGELQREHNEMQNKLAATMRCNVRMFGEPNDDSMANVNRAGQKCREQNEDACWAALSEPDEAQQHDDANPCWWRNETWSQPVASRPDTKDTNPKDSIGCTKPPLHTVPTGPLFEAGAVLLHGHCKYRGYNWRVAGVRSSIYYDAVMRHLMAWWEGEDTDPDSGLPHIAHAISGLCVLRDSQMIGNCTDDRPPRRLHPFNALRPLVAEMAQKPQPEPYTEQNTAATKSPA